MTLTDSTKLVWRSLAAAAVLIGLAGAAGAQPLRVEVIASAGAAGDVATLVRSAAPSTVSVTRRSSRSAIVEVDAAGYNRLMADPRFELVNLLSGETPAEPTETRMSNWTIALVHPTLAPRAGVDARIAAGAPVRAKLVRKSSAGTGIPDTSPLGPGYLEARLLDARGKLLARTVVADPRIVRSEDADSAGRLDNARTFIRTQVELEVRLPAMAGAAVLDISEPEGPTHRPRVIARLVIR